MVTTLWMSHYSVAGLLRVGCSYVKRGVEKIKWDDQVSDRNLKTIKHITEVVEQEDLVRVKRCTMV